MSKTGIFHQFHTVRINGVDVAGFEIWKFPGEDYSITEVDGFDGENCDISETMHSATLEGAKAKAYAYITDKYGA